MNPHQKRSLTRNPKAMKLNFKIHMSKMKTTNDKQKKKEDTMATETGVVVTKTQPKKKPQQTSETMDLKVK